MEWNKKNASELNKLKEYEVDYSIIAVAVYQKVLSSIKGNI